MEMNWLDRKSLPYSRICMVGDFNASKTVEKNSSLETAKMVQRVIVKVNEELEYLIKKLLINEKLSKCDKIWNKTQQPSV